MEEKMEEAKMQSYKEALHCLEEIVLFYDRDGNILNWNSETVNELYYDRDDLKSVTVRELLHEESDKCFKDTAGKQSFEQFEAVVYRKNGTCFHADIACSILNNEYTYGLCRIRSKEEAGKLNDTITDLKRELEEARSAKSSFVANVTHELRTPLNGMKGMANLLLETELTKEQRDTVKTMMDCFGSMEHIVNDILDYSKLSAGKMQLEEHSFAFYPWVDGVIAVHKKLIEQKNLQFELNVDEKIPAYLIGDSYHLTQVINNLLNNAIKFTAIGKVALDIALQKEVDDRMELLLSVTDTGIGICQEKKKQLFQSFVQGDPSITRRFGGTGLGLSICKEIVTLMGGTIQAESQYGKGSRFYFTVWVKKEQRETNEEKPKVLHEVIGTKSVSKLMEQLKLCLRFKSYEKAEETVHLIKEATKDEQKEVSKKAFRLELALRKQNEEKIQSQYLELCKACER